MFNKDKSKRKSKQYIVITEYPTSTTYHSFKIGDIVVRTKRTPKRWEDGKLAYAYQEVCEPYLEQYLLDTDIKIFK